MTVGEKIRTLRNDQKITQKELGEACGIAESTIRRYELGKLNPKYETRKKIADALGVPVFQLLPDDAPHTKALDKNCYSFGDKMLAVRKEKHITQEELAKKLGISLNAVGRYERGERDPQFLTACKIAQVLDAPLDSFVPNELKPFNDTSKINFHENIMKRFLTVK